MSAKPAHVLHDLSLIAKRLRTTNQLGLGLNSSIKKTRKREFLGEMDQVVPWAALLAFVEPRSPRAMTGSPPFAIETVLRIHYLQQWFGLSAPVMEEALHDVLLYREFVGLGDGASRLPDETTILRFRHLLKSHDSAADMLQAKGLLLRTDTAVDATLIAPPSSTKNALGERDPKMKQTKKGNLWRCGMKAYFGADAASGLVHTVVGAAANVHDLNVAGALLRGEEHAAFGDSGYQGVHKRPEAAGPTWHVAMRAGKRRMLNPFIEPDFSAERLENMNPSVRAKVKRPFRVIKQQFGFTKVHYRGLAKNTAQIATLFALPDLWMARRRLMAAWG